MSNGIATERGQGIMNIAYLGALQLKEDGLLEMISTEGINE